MMLDNPILRTDSYKLTHWDMYPPKTTGVFSYFEMREGAKYPFAQFFGLQYLMERYLAGPIVKREHIDEAEELIAVHLGDVSRFNRKGWERIVDVHGGCLPISIRAVPEGSVVPVSNVLMTVENTDPECYWLTNYLETLLSHVWYSSTVATLSYATKQMIKDRLVATGSPLAGIDFMLHDFGYRGATGDEAAAIGGAGHLINFKGSDTVAAMALLHDYYDASFADLAFSVPATEHSIMTAEGVHGEYGVLDRLIRDYPTGILSVVSDSYDIYAFVEQVCKRKDAIMARDGVFVVRPDSTTARHNTPEDLTAWIVNRLYNCFGGIESSTGHRTLDSHVRTIWGDGIQPKGIKKILLALDEDGYAAQNMVFGMGGGLLQKVDRDTQRSAFKSSAQRIDHEQWRSVQKNPLDPSKKSKGGRLKLVKVDGEYQTVAEEVKVTHGTPVGENLLVPVFADGRILKRYTFDEVRANANAS